MESKRLKNSRVRRMLIMVDERVSTPAGEPANSKSTILDNQAEAVAMSSEKNKLQGNDNLSNIINYKNIEESMPVKPSTSSTSCYNLRELPITTVYVENDLESDDALFSSDHSEYIPTPERVGRNYTPSSISDLSVNSQCFDKIDIINTPGTISNLSLILDNSDFVASSTVVYKVCNQQSLDSDTTLLPLRSLTNNSFNMDLDETIQPQTSKEIGNYYNILNDTLIENIQTEFIHIRTDQEQQNNLLLQPSHSQIDNNAIDCSRNINDTEAHIDETIQPQTSKEIGNCYNILNDTLIENIQTEFIHIRTDQEQQNTLLLQPSHSQIDNNAIDCSRNINDTEAHIDENEPSTSKDDKVLTRKRQRNESDWQRNKNKLLKNSGNAYEGYNSKKKYPKKSVGPVCECKMNCGGKFSVTQRQDLFDTFYGLSNRENQWLYITRHVKIEDIRRMTLQRKINRTQTIKYYFPLDGEDVVVCKKFFVNTLNIGEAMIYTAIEKAKSDDFFCDKRGKHANRPRKMSSDTELSIITHIKLFPTVESHFTRKSSSRQYLSENLNISKLYRFYTDWFEHQNYSNVTIASKRQYEYIFNTRFNYSFFKPKKDQCATCMLYEQADASEKEQLKENYKNHLHRKERIRQIKNEEKDTFDKNSSIVAVFDLQKVLNIPQSNVGIFHYKRKYPVYNFTIYDALRKKGYCYVWHYHVAKRGCIEIGSCLLKFLKSERERGINTISFYSDGCYGQNKNRYIFALYVYAAKTLQLSITHRFFETGHSQNEGDSMHACIERNMKNKVIYTPEQIYNVILNSKVTGEKYSLTEIEGSDILDIKKLVNPAYWRRDTNGNVIRWSDVMDVHVTPSQPGRLYFKYDFDGQYLELDTLHSTQIRRRGRKSKPDSASEDNITLEPAYHHPIPISKALHTDLLFLCNTGAIPRYYHSFYESLTYSQDNIIDTSTVNEETSDDD